MQTLHLACNIKIATILNPSNTVSNTFVLELFIQLFILHVQLGYRGAFHGGNIKLLIACQMLFLLTTEPKISYSHLILYLIIGMKPLATNLGMNCSLLYRVEHYLTHPFATLNHFLVNDKLFINTVLCLLTYFKE